MQHGLQSCWTICSNPRGSLAMRKLIELLGDEHRASLQVWADANVAVFSSALLVELLQRAVGLLLG